MAAEQPIEDTGSKPPRTWRPMALWTAGILVVLGLTWSMAAVAVPLWQVHAVVKEVENARGGPVTLTNRMLNEPRQAARKIRLYLRVVRPANSSKNAAYMLLLTCNARCIPAALDGLADENPNIRLASVHALDGLKLGAQADDVVRALQAMTRDSDEQVRAAAAKALKKIRDEEPPIPAGEDPTVMPIPK